MSKKNIGIVASVLTALLVCADLALAFGNIPFSPETDITDLGIGAFVLLAAMIVLTLATYALAVFSLVQPSGRAKSAFVIGVVLLPTLLWVLPLTV